MEGTWCQSCGMPLREEKDFGTEKDGAKSGDYCAYCYDKGAFTREMTMDEMIATNLQYLDQWEVKMSPEEAEAMMREHFPTLKRWQN